MEAVAVLFLVASGLWAQPQTLEQLGPQALEAAQQGRYQDAAALYERMLKLAPGSRDLRYDYALVLNRLGRNRESLTVLGKAVSAEELALAGINHRALADLDAAERALRAAAALTKDASVVADLGMVLLDREKYDEAERVFRRYPDEVQSMLGLGLAAFARGRNGDAEKLFSAAVAREPQSADLHASLGDVYFATDRFAEADEAYRRAMRLDPMNAEFRVKAGRNLLRLDKQAEAREQFAAAVKLEPLQAEAHLELGRIAAAAQQDDVARQHLQIAATADPSRSAAHYQLGLLYRRLGLTTLSSAAMRRVEQIRKQADQPYRIDMTSAAVVVEGPPAERRWGRYQFPTTYRMADGRLIAFVHVEADSADSYGMAQRTFVSSDDGGSWREDADAAKNAYGLRLPRGEWLRIDTTTALPAGELQLPQSTGTFNSYGSAFTLYRWPELPVDLKRIFFQRFIRGAWAAESPVVDDPHGLRYVVGGKFPRIWWGDMQPMPDGTLLAVTYPSIDAKPPYHFASSCWRSVDKGKTWQMLARIPYAPDEQADSKAAQRDGFTEPAFTRLRDGSLLTILRTTDGNGVGPMYQARSRDGGRTWSKPAVMAPNGVLPRLLRLDNGVLVLASGRPGVQIRISLSGLGDDWSEAVDIVPPTSEKLDLDSCGYTSLVPLGSDSFLITYSWFQKPDASGAPRKTVLSRRVRIAVRPAPAKK